MSRLIRGWKKDEFTTPYAIFEVGKQHLDTKALATYIFLVSRLEIEGQATPSHKEIAEACCFSLKSAERALDQLEEVGLIHRIHRQKGPKQKDTNLYIIYHPDQVGLTKKKQGTDTMTGGYRQFDGRGADNLTEGGTVNLTVGTATMTDNISMSVSPSVGLSVDAPAPSNPGEEIQTYFQKAFGEKLTDMQLEEILSFGVEHQKVKEIIRKVALYVPIRSTPFSVIIRAVAAEANGKPWQFLEDAGETKPERKQQKRKGSKQEADLPKSIRQQMEEQDAAKEQAATREKIDPQEVAKKRAQLLARLKAAGQQG